MPENEFEKAVQQTVEELTINPAIEVWSKVSMEIGKQQKRRKRIVFFFIFFCFLLAGILFFPNNKIYLFQNFAEKKIDQPSADTTHKIDKINPHQTEKGIADKTPNSQAKKATVVVTDINIEGIQLLKAPLSTIKSAGGPSFISIHKKLFTSGQNHFKFKAGSAVETADTTNLPYESDKEYFFIKNNFDPLVQKICSNTRNTIIQPTAINNARLFIKNNLIPAGNNSFLTAAKKTKWILGINLTLGYAGNNNIFTGANNSNYFNYSAPVTGNIVGQQGSYQPAQFKQGAGFTIGVSATKRLSVKNNFIVGLNYKLLTSRLLVGAQTTVNNQFNYSTGNLKMYHNAFHFIELPVTFQKHIFNIKIHPVFLEAGISIAHLLHSNALQFDTLQGNYYKDNTILNKNIFSFAAGISFKINGSKSSPILLGAQIYYSASTIANTGLYAKLHYNFAGITLHKILSKK